MVKWIQGYQGWRINESSKLRKNASVNARWSMASNSEDPDLLSQLSRDPEDSVRNRAAANPYLPESDWLRLAKDPVDSVRHHAGENPNAPMDILFKLIKQGDLELRMGLMRNPRAPEEILDWISGTRLSWADKQGLMINPNTSAETIRKLLKIDYGAVDKYAAKHPNTPVDILTQFSHTDPNEMGAYSILTNLAENPNTPPEDLARISRHGIPQIDLKLLNNPNLGLETLVSISRSEYDNKRAKRMLAELWEAEPGLRKRIEELESLADLGFRGDEDALNLDQLDI